ncbi:MAG: response regulator, partial [Candidatus Acidiferrales bacterium]
MSTPPTASAEANATPRSTASQVAIERRRRKRAKITAQVHVRGINSPEPFEEVCKSIDVSRDGLLFTAARTGYWKGQRLEVTFPYSSAAAALNTPQPAEIVRVVEQDGHFAIAVQFINAKSEAAANSSKVDPAMAHPALHSSGAKQQSVVLIVESDPKTADIMRNVLSSDGYTVVIVPTAQQALDILRTTVPAVFLAEVEGTDMSGHDLCLIIKRNDRLQRVPVILLTKSAQPADYSASHQLGAVVCMAKPFKPERLLHVVRLVAPPPAQKSAYGASRYTS